MPIFYGPKQVTPRSLEWMARQGHLPALMVRTAQLNGKRMQEGWRVGVESVYHIYLVYNSRMLNPVPAEQRSVIIFTVDSLCCPLSFFPTSPCLPSGIAFSIRRQRNRKSCLPHTLLEIQPNQWRQWALRWELCTPGHSAPFILLQTQDGIQIEWWIKFGRNLAWERGVKLLQ